MLIFLLGIGVLYINKSRPVPIHVTCLLHGGGQEHGIRSGTESLLLIVGLGTASKLAYEECRAMAIHMLKCKLLFIDHLRKELVKEKVSFTTL